MPVKKLDWMIHEDLFLSANQDFTIFFTWENSKMCNITSQYFNILTKSHQQAVSCIWQKIFLYVIPFRFIVPCFKVLYQSTYICHLVHLKACFYNYVAKPWSYFTFPVQLLDRSRKTHKNIGKKMNFAKQISAMEPISIIFADS